METQLKNELSAALIALAAALDLIKVLKTELQSRKAVQFGKN
jgi:hypothetical protein